MPVPHNRTLTIHKESTLMFIPEGYEVPMQGPDAPAFLYFVETYTRKSVSVTKEFYHQLFFNRPMCDVKMKAFNPYFIYKH